MALTVNTQLNALAPDYYGGWVVASAAECFSGGLAGLDTTLGTVTNYDDAAGHLLVGYFTKYVLGDGTKKASVQLRGDIVLVNVVGTTAITDHGKPVYATDNGTYTLTRPADDGQPVGMVMSWIASTQCRVLLLSLQTLLALSLAGGNRRKLYIGSLGTRSLETTSATNLLTGFALGGHGKIVGLSAIADDFDASFAAGTQVLTLEINDVAVTSCALTLDCTGIDSQGDKALIKTAVAPTAANEFHDQDLLDVVLVGSGTGFTPGVADGPVDWALYIDVEYLPGN